MRDRFTPILLFVWSGLLIWAVDFLFIYVFAAIACARQFARLTVADIHVVPLVAIIATLAGMVGTTAVMWRAATRAAQMRQPPPAGLIHFLGLALAALGLVAVVWTALPPLLLQSRCA